MKKLIWRFDAKQRNILRIKKILWVGRLFILSILFISLWGGIRTRNLFPEFQIEINFGAFQIIVCPINNGFKHRSHSIRTVFAFYLNTFFSEIFWNDLKSTLEHFDQKFEKNVRIPLLLYLGERLTTNYVLKSTWYHEKASFFIECVLINCKATKRKWQTEKNQ